MTDTATFMRSTRVNRDRELEKKALEIVASKSQGEFLQQHSGLIYAICSFNSLLTIANYIVEHDVNFPDEYGMTALHHAAAFGDRSVVRLLIASGRCNYLLTDKIGRYASDLAFESARDTVLREYLLKKQARQYFEVKGDSLESASDNAWGGRQA